MSYGTVASGETPEYGKEAYGDEETHDLNAGRSGSDDPRPPNFPPWLCSQKCRCFHHDISTEVRDKSVRPIIYREYIGWYCALIAYVTNVVALGARIHPKFDGAVRDFVIGFCVMIFIYPLTLIVYLSLYGAARNVGKSWTWWWIFQALIIFMEAFFAVGFPKTGCAGMGTMIQGFKSHHKTVGFASLASFLFWATLCCFHLADYIILWRYRSAVEGGYTRQKEDDTEEDVGYVPPAITEAPSKATNNAGYKSSTAGNPNPEWHQPVGSAYETPSTKGAHAPIKSDAGNPFGDDGGLDDFYN